MNVTEAAGLLELCLPATRSQIKKAYYKIARQSHPDLHPANPEAHARMVAVNEALEVLLHTALSMPTRPPREKTARPAANVRRDPPAQHHVVWSGPPKVTSEFFERRGFLVRATDGGVTFRIMKAGRHLFTLERQPGDPALLICRNELGEFQTIDGVAFWVDDGTSIVPYVEERMAVSEFFEKRGFLVRPTDGRATFRVMKPGRHLFTLERHRDDPELLICRNERGEFQTIDGVAFWIDDGTSIVPYVEGRI